MIHAELDIRHTRKHMPTRRIALAGMFLPTSGSADGLVLLDATLRTFLPRIDPDLQPLLERVVGQQRAQGRAIAGGKGLDDTTEGALGAVLTGLMVPKLV